MTAPWWRDAVIYQIYIRSFADGNGDGVGDIAGINSRLPYLRTLGVDAIWITPWYRSPQVDSGYDVADFRDIDSCFGSLAEAEALICNVHAHGLRIILDLVPNHTSHQHQWFRAALAAGVASPERDRYIFRSGQGPDGARPPNNWRSAFGGPAWTRVGEGQWYLHLFAPEQPDLNWANSEVRAEFESILRFWFDRGVDGFRIDVADGLCKDPALQDLDLSHESGGRGHPHWDRDGVHEIYRSWRRIAEGYPGDRQFVAEALANAPDQPERLARYVRPGHLHTAFNFSFLRCPWNGARLRKVIDDSLASLETVGAPATWVLSNHDVPRQVSRYGTSSQQWNWAESIAAPTDLRLGLRRARAAALLMLALPGSAYIYQGEELGLPQVEDLPEEVLQDPVWKRSGHASRGRDGCRVPIPWSGTEPPFGFSAPDVKEEPWLPQPKAWVDFTTQAQRGEPGSMLELYRSALRIRRQDPALGAGDLRWNDTEEGLLWFTRTPGFGCVVNVGAQPFVLPEDAEILLTSDAVSGRVLPADTTAWIRR